MESDLAERRTQFEQAVRENRRDVDLAWDERGFYRSKETGGMFWAWNYAMEKARGQR